MLILPSGSLVFSPRSATRKLASASVSALILLIRAYQLALSPLLGKNCRFEPTCSAYAVAALRQHGVLKGGLLSLHRILRCNRYCRGGYDPVPGVKKGQRGT